MVDPKTGKLYYEEPEPEPKNLDLDDDGVIEEEELQQMFEEADTNDDGYIDEEEAKVANLDPESIEKLNKFKKIMGRIKQNLGLSHTDTQMDMDLEEIKNIIADTLSKQNKKDDDDTITIF